MVSSQTNPQSHTPEKGHTMSLSVNSPIIYTDIDHIKMLKDLKVWLLIGFNNDKVVIKKDAVHAPQIRSVNPIIKAIAPTSKLKILTPAETAGLNQFVKLYEDWSREYEAMGLDLDPDEDQAVKDLKTVLGPMFPEPFVKMEAVALTDLEKALEKRLAPNSNKADLRAFTATLNAPGGLERLGKIIAVDLFNGNRDRFFPGSKSEKTIGGVSFKLRCLVNVGNVFHVTSAAGGEIGALDFVDPNSLFKDINKPLAEAERAANKLWPGRILADKKLRNAFAEDVVHDLETILSPRKSTFSLKTKLNSGAADRLSKGMAEGGRLIKSKLEAKYNPNRWTQGVRERYMIICTV